MSSGRAAIRSTFRLRGFSLRPDAAARLEALLTPLDAEDAEEWTEKILAALERRDADGSVVTMAALAAAVKQCSNAEAGDDVNRQAFNLIDAFKVPRFSYSVERKKYLLDENLGKPLPRIYSDPSAKAELFRARHQMLLQRTARHDLFTSGVDSYLEDKKKFRLKNVEFLLSTTAKLPDVIVLGMLTQVRHGTYSLEDPTGVIQLDLREAKFHHGLFTENCFVLVEGWYEDGVFHVTAMGLPPPEASETSRAYFGSANFFGGPLDTCAKRNSELQKLEHELGDDAMFVLISDVWLDRPLVMENLRKLFAGYAAVPPTCFILMGNFLSSPYGSQHARVLKEHLRALGEMISEYPELIESSRFVFVPGPTDPESANIFPRPQLPTSLTEELSKRVPRAEFASNPCRLQFYTHEIVVFREDIVTKMCRNCIFFPETGDIPTHFSKTLVCQGHLAPLPLHVCPVYWDFDRSMYLYPLPDLVVVGDKFDPFCTEQVGCKFVNPGSFSKNDFSFKTYLPRTKEIEDCQVPS